MGYQYVQQCSRYLIRERRVRRIKDSLRGGIGLVRTNAPSANILGVGFHILLEGMTSNKQTCDA